MKKEKRNRYQDHDLHLSFRLGNGDLEVEYDSPKDLVERHLLGIPFASGLDDHDPDAVGAASRQRRQDARREDGTFVGRQKALVELGMLLAVLVEALYLGMRGRKLKNAVRDTLNSCHDF